MDARSTTTPSSEDAAFVVEGLRVSYGDRLALTVDQAVIPDRKVTAFVGSSGCGKSTFLRCLNRMNDGIASCRVEGSVSLDGYNIYDKGLYPEALRAYVGMVFQQENLFPKSIFDNIAYGPRIHKTTKNRAELEEVVEFALRQAAIWGEVKDRLHAPAKGLSGGQKQRLCIARALAIKPRVLLMDEPCGSLDPISTEQIDELIGTLRGQCTIVIVTHAMEQAMRVCDYAGYFHVEGFGEGRYGSMVDFGTSRDIFINPQDPRTEAFVTGRIG